MHVHTGVETHALETIKDLKRCLVVPKEHGRVVHGRIRVLVEVLVVAGPSHVRKVRRRVLALQNGIPIDFGEILVLLHIIGASTQTA